MDKALKTDEHLYDALKHLKEESNCLFNIGVVKTKRKPSVS